MGDGGFKIGNVCKKCLERLGVKSKDGMGRDDKFGTHGPVL